MRNTRDDEKTSSPRNTGSLVSVLEAMKQALWANKDPRKVCFTVGRLLVARDYTIYILLQCSDRGIQVLVRGREEGIERGTEAHHPVQDLFVHLLFRLCK
eukprot:gb/GECG01009480.1/.p1 GENE.gb/GECG01009480.1/~~gb/GECG01009480.1/.p1  ORF type:complete len:100 (+),score=9.40 gb/GECG01009480.1/:1-300(+)